MNILMIEDDPHVANALSRVLKRGGHAVHVLPSLAHVREFMFDPKCAEMDVLVTDRDVDGADAWAFVAAAVKGLLPSRIVHMSGREPTNVPPFFFRKGADPASALLQLIERA